MRRLLLIGLVLALTGTGHAATVARVTVTTAATLLYTAPNTVRGALVLIRNPSGVSVYVGPASVTTATGFEIAAGDALSVSMQANETLYGIVAAATQVVHVIDGRNGS